MYGLTIGKRNFRKGIINGMEIIVRIKPNKLPTTVKNTASYPLPSNNNLWPGNADNTLSLSGAPRKHDGMKSVNVWVIDIEIINIAINNGEVNFSKNTENVKINNETKFM